MLQLNENVHYDPTTTFQACGMPNFVSDVRSLYALAQLAQQGVSSPLMVEIGSWSGRTALTLLNGAGPRARLHCFDLWFVQQDGSFPVHECGIPVMEGFCRNVDSHLFTRIFPHVGRSEFWASQWAQPLDMVYIDGDHSYQSVLQDIKAWMPHLKPGGIIAGHDYRWESVASAVRELLPEHEFITEDGSDPNRFMFPDPDHWGGVWWNVCS